MDEDINTIDKFIGLL